MIVTALPHSAVVQRDREYKVESVAVPAFVKDFKEKRGEQAGQVSSSVKLESVDESGQTAAVKTESAGP